VQRQILRLDQADRPPLANERTDIMHADCMTEIPNKVWLPSSMLAVT
jgi:hypothetical protein